MACPMFIQLVFATQVFASLIDPLSIFILLCLKLILFSKNKVCAIKVSGKRKRKMLKRMKHLQKSKEMITQDGTISL